MIDGEEIADDVLRPVDPRWVTVERIASWIVCTVVSVGLLVGILVTWLTQEPPLWLLGIMVGVWLVVAATLAWLAEHLPGWEYDRLRYRVSPLGIEIRKGIWWRRIISVPRSRIQHTDVAQGPLLRRYGLATLVVHTAGTENASVDLSGLAYETALGLRDYLIRGGERDAV